MSDLASQNLVIVFDGFTFHSRHVFDIALEAQAFVKGFKLASALGKNGMDLRAYYLDDAGEAAMRSIEDALQVQRAYDAVMKIRFDGMHYRRDIGQRALR